MPTPPNVNNPPANNDNIWDKLLSGIQSAIELRVVTYVGDVDIKGELKNPTMTFPQGAEAKGKTLATSINMVQGDISTAIPEPYWAPEQEVVRNYHQAQVEQANKIVERNVRLFVELANELRGELTRVKPGQS